ncbi:MAG TPA: TonB-dependent receptor plug domain-containing protein, partial [Bacteroidota bacterium]|nr:TonB-dependent receptor plug domain-containing protein [Bacteroidota bacterium]
MKTLRLFSAVLPILFTHTVFSSAPGDASASPDTAMRSYTMDEIVVTSTRRATSASTAPSAVTVVRRETIDAMPGTLLSAALSSTPGMSLRAYGGGASVETISLRGMSPEHTLVLVDGERSNSFENGLADFGILASSSVERVEILRGGASALYGSDAVGGVVNVITRSAGEGMHGSASTMLGSSHTSGSALRLEGGGEGFGIRGSLEREQGRGDYNFKFNDGRTETTLTRAGEDYSLLTGVVRGDWTISPELRSSASLSYTDADRGSPGAVTDPASAGKARLADRLEYIRAGIAWEASPQISIRANGSAHYDVEHYDDPGQILNGTTIHSIYTNHDGIITPEVLFSFSPALSGAAGVEY